MILTYRDTVLQHFETETQDLAGVEWSPNGCVLAAWDACLEVRIHLINEDSRGMSWDPYVICTLWSRMKHLRIHVNIIIPKSFSNFVVVVFKYLIYVYSFSTKCCCIPWMGVCYQPTVLMNGHWALNQSPGVPVASFWPSVATMRRYNLYKNTTCF